MKLGILATSDKHLQHVIGLVKAATEAGHEVSLFCMDEATKFLDVSKFRSLCKVNNLTISLCRHSAESQKVNLDKVPKDIVSGSQFNNAIMNHESDKIIVL